MQSNLHRLGPLPSKGILRAPQPDSALDQLEQQLRMDFLRDAQTLVPVARIEHALREAAAQAAATAFPALWFPELAREKFLDALNWAQRQQDIRIRSFVSFSA